MLYRDFLESAFWKDIRFKRLAKDGFKCRCCSSIENLEVHHRYYRTDWFQVKIWDLVTLCAFCHDSFHKNADLFHLFINQLKAVENGGKKVLFKSVIDKRNPYKSLVSDMIERGNRVAGIKKL